MFIVICEASTMYSREVVNNDSWVDENRIRRIFTCW